MYRFNVNEKYMFCDTILYEKVELNIDSSKLFHLDEFNVIDNKPLIVYSQIRTNEYIAGILDLSKTYGKENNKFLYLCKPDDNRTPPFFISYHIPPNFDKSIQYLYITFKYKHWDYDTPYGIITTNIGRIEELNNLYEYMLYCKSLNQPIQKFTKKTIDEIKKHENIIQEITKIHNLPCRQGHIFTVDSTKSVDYDDAISIKDNVISVYISNVPIILDYLNLWDSFSRRISTIYLPDKKRAMLPNVLTDCICSLKEKENRICIVLDIFYDDKQNIVRNEFSICNAKISRNYDYEQPKLLKHSDYLKIKNLLKVENSYQVVSKLMIYFNKECALKMSHCKKGIFKTLQNNISYPKNYMDYIELFKVNASKYDSYENQVYHSFENKNIECYLQMSSPIRRLVDLLNMYMFSQEYNLNKYSDNAGLFYQKWYNEMDYINKTMRYIRKVQYKCKLISLFEQNKNEIFKGYTFDKIQRSDKKFHYNVYLPDLNIFTSMTIQENLKEYEEHSFKLYMLENSIKNKIKISYIS